MVGQFEKALGHLRAAASTGDSIAMMQVGTIFLNRADFLAALDAFESARLSAKRTGDVALVAEADLGIAELEYVRGNLPRAIEIAKRLGDPQRQTPARSRSAATALLAACEAADIVKRGPVSVWTEGYRVREGLERVLRTDEGDPLVAYALGRFYLDSPPGFGDLDRAETLLARAAQGRRDNAVFRAMLIHVIHLRGRLKEGQRELELFERSFGRLPGAQELVERLKKGLNPLP